jgi:hypothetical protein
VVLFYKKNMFMYENIAFCRVEVYLCRVMSTKRPMRAEDPTILDGGMTAAAYLADMLALKTLNTNLSHHLNRGDGTQVSGFFTDLAAFMDGDVHIIGATRIAAHLQREMSRSSTRLLFAEPYLRIVGPDRALGYCVSVAYRQANGVLRQTISDVDDEYVIGSDQRWRISRRSVQPVLQGRA